MMWGWARWFLRFLMAWALPFQTWRGPSQWPPQERYSWQFAPSPSLGQMERDQHRHDMGDVVHTRQREWSVAKKPMFVWSLGALQPLWFFLLWMRDVYFIHIFTHYIAVWYTIRLFHSLSIKYHWTNISGVDPGNCGTWKSPRYLGRSHFLCLVTSCF